MEARPAGAVRCSRARVGSLPMSRTGTPGKLPWDSHGGSLGPSLHGPLRSERQPDPRSWGLSVRPSAFAQPAYLRGGAHGVLEDGEHTPVGLHGVGEERTLPTIGRLLPPCGVRPGRDEARLPTNGLRPGREEPRFPTNGLHSVRDESRFPSIEPHSVRDEARSHRIEPHSVREERRSLPIGLRSVRKERRSG